MIDTQKIRVIARRTVSASSGLDLKDSLQDAQDFGKELIDVYAKLRVLASKDEYFISGYRKEGLSRVMFAIPKDPKFDYVPWLQHNFAPINKTFRGKQIKVAVTRITREGSVSLLVTFGHHEDFPSR